MNCLQFNSIRFSSISSRSYLECDNGCAVRSLHLGFCRRSRRLRMSALKVVSPSENDEMPEGKSEVYSNEMTQAMGAVLTYRHELGMNYNFILDDLIVGSCLQTPVDVDKLRKIGVKTIFCVQQDSDLEYFGVDIKSIQQHTGEYTNIHHCRAPIRDFDAFDLRLRLPAVVSKLYKEVNQNGGITYIHCTAGLGRAPAVALAYMYWVLGYRLNDAHDLLLNKRSCFPKVYAIKCATVDILSGQRKKYVTLNWHGDNCSTVEVSGLDIGWGQRIPLKFDQAKGLWSLRRELPEGHYEYKYIVDGEWTCSSTDQITNANTDGHVNNCINVMCEDLDGEARERRERLMGDGDLTNYERQTIVRFLDSYKDDDLIVNLSLEENR